MLTISRSVLRRFRTLCKRGGLHKSPVAGGPVVTFVGGADGCRIQAASTDVAIEYHEPGDHPPEMIRLPLAALEVCEGRDDGLVTIEAHSGDQIRLSWSDRGVPRRSEQEQPKAAGTTFPSAPPTSVANGSDLWAALGDAVATTDAQSSRYALGCLHLRGALGRLETTDGRQVLVQSGYRFGFEEDLLIPGSKLLGSADVTNGEPIDVGRTEEYVGFGVGCWLILLRIQKDARFPKIDQILPNPDAAKSRLELSQVDAGFLKETIPRLPCDDTLHDPITLDLNGRVLVRCRETAASRPTEVFLGSSKLTGEPVILNTDRRFVERELKLGFRSVRLYGPDSPAMCVDEHRRFLWALLDKGSAIPRHDDPQRIDAPSRADVVTGSTIITTKPKEKVMAVALPAVTRYTVKPSETTNVPSAKPVHARAAGSAIEQALTLRDTLHSAAQQAGELARSLKQQKRQSRIVASTLASLKELQRVAG
ncbi:MAG: hypothetical protein K8U03_09575 [Planctomycetia bacterium]|nr:hypothetical protein [Planctomycetia bacterium]